MLEEGDRIKVFQNIICNDSRELTGTVIYYDNNVDIICFNIDASLKLNEYDTGRRHVPANNGSGWVKI